MNVSLNCTVCGHITHRRVYGSLVMLTCKICGHWNSEQTPKINSQAEHIIDVDKQLKRSLQPFRRRVYKTILAKANSKITHLDVGCSTGQFLVMSRAVGNKTLGIEPETLFADEAKSNKLDIFNNFAAVPHVHKNKIDLITFIDVLGHIPRPREALMESKELLSNDGILLIKTPVAEGFFFCMARILNFIGIKLFWHRIWQTQFSSPQIHYFTKQSLKAIADDLNMDIDIQTAPTISLDGLFERLRPSFPTNRWGHVLTYLLLLYAFPIIKLLSNDSKLAHLKKR